MRYREIDGGGHDSYGAGATADWHRVQSSPRHRERNGERNRQRSQWGEPGELHLVTELHGSDGDGHDLGDVHHAG